MSYNLVKLNTARNSLRYVIKAFEIKELYIPYYICPSVRTSVSKENCKIFYYHIDRNFRPIDKLPKNAYILYPNYFGVCSLIVEELSLIYSNLIVDNAHSFYSKPIGIASFNSLRKFFPILRDGSFLYTKKLAKIDIENDDYSYELKNMNFKEFCKNENRLDLEDIKYISKSTLSLLPDINPQKRIEKFHYWKNRLGGNIELNKNDIPFVYPHIAENQIEAINLVETLEKEGLQIFRYWNNMPDSYPEKIFYTNLVSIPLNTSD